MGTLSRKQLKKVLIPGEQYFGVNFGPASKVVKNYGRVSAIDVTTNKVVWSQKLTKPCYSGTLTTAGGSLDTLAPSHSANTSSRCSPRRGGGRSARVR